MKEIKIRDIRNKEWFTIDNVYLNGYAKLLKPMTTLVYIALCRHANSATQKCFPSIELIAEEVNINRTTVIKSIKQLEEWGIISVERSKFKDGKQANNVYVLLDKSSWREKPSRPEPLGKAESLSEEKPSRFDDISRVAQDDSNNTNSSNKTKLVTNSNAGIAEIIKALTDKIDQKNKNFYGNKTQRKACQDLLDSYGLDTTLHFIDFLSNNLSAVFNPPTTPVMLRDNWVRVTSAVKYVIKKEESKKPKVIFG